jgi:hypothetical protein
MQTADGSSSDLSARASFTMSAVMKLMGGAGVTEG